jgi:hypothetical protein
MLQYHFDRGLYMHEIVPGLFCGTQPRTPQEIEELSTNHGVTVIMNLQQDKDIQHWGVDFGANQHRANELGVALLRKPVRSKEVQGCCGTAASYGPPVVGSLWCCCLTQMLVFVHSIQTAVDTGSHCMYHSRKPLATWQQQLWDMQSVNLVVLPRPCLFVCCAGPRL